MYQNHDRDAFDRAEPITADSLSNIVRHPAVAKQAPGDEGEHRAFSSYIKQMQGVAMNKKVKNGNAFKVISAIIDRANSDTGIAWPSIAKLCKDTGLSEEQVRAALRYLEGYRKAKDGSMVIVPNEVVLDIERTIGGYNSETNEYTPRWSYGEDHRLKVEEERKARSENRTVRGRRLPRKSQGVPSENSKGTPPKTQGVPPREFGDNPYDTSSVSFPSDLPGQDQDVREADASPVESCSSSMEKRKTGKGFGEPDFDDVFAAFLQEFNFQTGRGPKEGEDWRGWFCGAMKKGVTRDDFLIAMELDDTICNCDINPRRLETFLEFWFPKEELIDQIVERINFHKARRDAKEHKPVAKPKPVIMKALAEPRPSTTSNASRSNTYGLSPSMRRERELAYGSANRHEVEVPF